MTDSEQLAEQQLLGYFHAKRGYGLIDLIINMGLSKKEWKSINKEVKIDITEQERTEVEEHFSKKIFS